MADSTKICCHFARNRSRPQSAGLIKRSKSGFHRYQIALHFLRKHSCGWITYACICHFTDCLSSSVRTDWIPCNKILPSRRSSWTLWWGQDWIKQDPCGGELCTLFMHAAASKVKDNWSLCVFYSFFRLFRHLDADVGILALLPAPKRWPWGLIVGPWRSCLALK